MTPERQWYAALIRDARVVEIRHNTGARWISGTFDNLDALLDNLRRCARSGAVYTSLNRPAGRKATNAMGAEALRDADIGTIVRLPFDFDPVRPTDTPSTGHELSLALAARDRFVTLLASFGWPTPALGMSGNGAHAVYRVCVEHNAEWRRAADVIYQGAKRQLADLDAVHFDTSVRNPGRIWRAYGTRNRKGAATAERPHRRAEIAIPAVWQAVTVAQIERVVRHWDTPAERSRAVLRRDNVVPLRPAGSGDYRTLDAARWFAAHQHYLGLKSGITHRVLCPWHETHTTAPRTGSVIFANEGTWPGFHCSHAHCQGRTIADVLALWPDADQFCARTWEARRHG